MARDIVRVELAGDGNVAVAVKAVHELLALVAEVGLGGEMRDGWSAATGDGWWWADGHAGMGSRGRCKLWVGDIWWGMGTVT